MSIPFENLSFNETVFVRNFEEHYAGGVLSSIFTQPQVSSGNASISSTFTKSGSLGPPSKSSKRFGGL
jgi:hypothetical protein